MARGAAIETARHELYEPCVGAHGIERVVVDGEVVCCMLVGHGLGHARTELGDGELDKPM